MCFILESEHYAVKKKPSKKRWKNKTKIPSREQDKKSIYYNLQLFSLGPVQCSMAD